ncbi:MAG: FkbM family methyltransferase [Candidatus Kapabacteria bacterium]|nr:FkbM family methyltransferase [Candidatus Kapabacteria bacterium]
MAEISLYQRLNKKGFTPKKVAEVGVYYPDTSQVYEYILNGTSTILVEADPDIAEIIRNYFSDRTNLILYENALYDYEGEIELVRSGASSFVSDLESSPAKINDNITMDDLNQVKVKSLTFDKIDEGDIDLIAIDIEGCEWYVLKYMKSRPTVISIETHGGLYKNPFSENIKNWMNENDYILWYKTQSDSVFVKRDKIKIDLLDRVKLIIRNIFLNLNKIKKRITRKIKGL